MVPLQKTKKFIGGFRMMRKVTFVFAVLAFVFSPALSRAADNPSGSQPSPGITGNAPSDNPGSPGTPQATPQGIPQVQAVQMPPENWTSLKGTVQAVDAAAKIVKIQDTTGAVLQVPVDRQVSIQKDGKRVKLSQIQPGDSITLAKRMPSSQEQQKSKTY
jgi:hypothetical protein